MKVFINPGHMVGVDAGAVNGMHHEAQIALNVGGLVNNYLKNVGYDVMMMQSDNLCGESPAYPNVCSTANAWGADVFVSIHCNAASPVAKGTECFVFSVDSESEKLANCIQSQIVYSLNTVDRGVKVNPKLIVLKYTNMVAVLVEMAFISNDDDLKLLTEKQDEFARAIARGISDYNAMR